jgi:alkylhydroperoxidase family enzyme
MSSGDVRLDTLIRLICGRALSLPPLPTEVDVIDGASEADSVVTAFAEQFVVDVSGIGRNQRKQLLTVLGDKAFRTVTAIFIADYIPRVWSGLEALGLGRPGNGRGVAWDHDTDPTLALIEGFLPAVARLRKLDPVTTEIVRLRGAAQHNCRACQSRRDSTALDQGGSESLYAEIEHYGTSEHISDRHRAALRYVDGMIWSPSRFGSDVVAGIRAHFSEEEALELTFDVMRNACNKIMVSLGADAPRVEEGTELFRIAEDGQTIFAS